MFVGAFNIAQVISYFNKYFISYALIRFLVHNMSIDHEGAVLSATLPFDWDSWPNGLFVKYYL